MGYEEVLTAIRRHGSYSLQGRGVNDNLQLVLTRRDEDLQLALQKRDEENVVALQMILQKRDEDLRLTLHTMLAAQTVQHSLAVQNVVQESVQQLETSLLASLALRFSNQLLSLGGHIRSVVVAAVKDALNLKRSQAKRRSVNVQDLPEDQRGTTRQAGPLALGLSSVAAELLPELC